MYTLVDFMTHIKGVEYLISVAAIAGFILFIEVLKPQPFKTLMDNAKEDLDHMKETGGTLRTTRRLLAAPFIGLAYVVSLPFVFVYAFARELTSLAAEGLGKVVGTASFGWRPTEAYLAGKKEKKEKTEKTEKSEAPKDEAK